MGFASSFIIICFAGFWSYALYHRYGLSKGHRLWLAYYAIFIVGGLMAFDTLMLFGLLDFIFPFLNQIPWVDIENGSDFTWNSFQLLGIDWNINYNDPGLFWIALMIILSYPMWFKFFSNGSSMFFGGPKPYQVGTWYLLAPTKKPKEGEKVAKTPKKT
ncbi:MAG: hypothetical protein ACTSR8_05200 [Promethearchaeota archaeon]